VLFKTKTTMMRGRGGVRGDRIAFLLSLNGGFVPGRIFTEGDGARWVVGYLRRPGDT